MIDQTAETLSKEIGGTIERWTAMRLLPSGFVAIASRWADAVALLEQERDEARKDAAYHSDCRPNRRRAEAAMADAKALNDWRADVTSAVMTACGLEGGLFYSDVIAKIRELKARADASASALIALQQFVEHTSSCLKCNGDEEAEYRCICGLSTLLDQVIPRQEEQTEAHP